MRAPVYATREMVIAALGGQPSSRYHSQIDRAIASGARAVDALCHRRFYPELGTRTFDWPADGGGVSWRLWLDDQELLSATSVSAGGDDITTGVFLRPDSGPPFTHLELDLASSSWFSTSGTPQRAISVTGVWAGAPVEETAVGVTLEGVDDSEFELDVSDSSSVGVGSLLRLDDERFIVVRRALLDTGQELATTLEASKAGAGFDVADGTALHAGEEITVGAERMVIRDIAGNTVLVDRATDGLGALTTHAIGATVYAPRTLVVDRGAVGTAAAEHMPQGATVYRWDPPALVQDLCVAEAINRLQNEGAGYARTAGSQENEREVSGRQLLTLRSDVCRAHGRKARTRAV
jgi:hypothetical protein